MNKDIKNAVILAAGSGTRLGYLGHLLPKTLFPIYDRPIIHHIIDLLEKTGIENDGRIIEIIEKPKEPKHRYRGCGIYMFKPEIFEYIKNTEEDSFRKEKDITTVINNVAKDMKAYAYMFDGFHININNYEELYNATKLIRKYSR